MPNSIDSAQQSTTPRQAPPPYQPQTAPEGRQQSERQQAYRSDTPDQYPPSARPASHRQRNGAETLARALGWFSIGLGAAEVLAPRAFSRATGIVDRPWLVRAFGAREIAAGVGILTQKERNKQAGWLWARVAGDAMDLALLGASAAGSHSGRRQRRLALATAAVAGVAVLDVMSGMRQSRQSAGSMLGTAASGEVDVEKSVTVNRSAEDCYRFWRDFENFPRFMKHLDDVSKTSDKQSHWRARAPAGSSVEWDAEITVDQPNELLAWQSVGDADVPNAGTVRFERAPGGRGTVVRVALQYRPPGGRAGAMIAKLFGEEPALQIDQDLRRFKQLIETGEIPTTVGQPVGARGTLTRLLFRQGEPG